MFEKARVAFTKKEVFGTKFTPAIDTCFCTVSKMVYNDKINPDGTIDINKNGSLSLKELWSYVYYLHFYNHTNVPVFKSMTNQKNGKANAVLFYTAVTAFVENVDEDTEEKPAKPFDNTTLIIFINNVIEEFGKQLVNPIFDYLQVLLKKNVLTRISGITLVTGKDDVGNNATSSANKIRIVTDPNSVANANVKVKLMLDEK